jgi:hypothetical protein
MPYLKRKEGKVDPLENGVNPVSLYTVSMIFRAVAPELTISAVPKK